MSVSSGSSGFGGDSLNSNAYGSSTFMSRQQANDACLPNYKPEAGSIAVATFADGTIACINQAGHLTVIAPARSGKGIGILIPNAALYRNGSFVGVDLRGEVAAMMTRYRQRLGQKVINIDPAGVLKRYGIEPEIIAQGFDPVTHILCGGDEKRVLDDIPLLAEAIIPEGGNADKDQHWVEGGRATITLCLTFLAVFCPETDRNLIALARAVNGIPHSLEKMAGALTNNPHPIPALADVIARRGAWWAEMNDRERGSYISMARRGMRWTNSTIWSDYAGRMDFDPEELATGKLTVFIIVPYERLSEYQPFIRMLLTSLIIGAMRGRKETRVPTLMALDEFRAIGKLSIIEQSIPVAEGSGLKYLFILQSLDQLEAMFPDKTYHGLIANSAAQVLFNISDQNTADYASKFMGTHSAAVPSGGGISYVSRPLMTPEEVRLLPPDELLLFMRNRPPARLGKINILKHEPFKTMLAQGVIAPNPLYAPPGAKPQAGPQPRTGILSLDAALNTAAPVRIDSQAVTAALESKYPGKEFRLENDQIGFDESWTNPHTGETVSAFVAILHVSLLEPLTKGGSSHHGA